MKNRFPARPACIAVLFLLAGVWSPGQEAAAPTNAAVTVPPPPGAWSQALIQEPSAPADAFYRANGYRTVWIEQNRALPGAAALVEAIRHAEDFGLEPGWYQPDELKRQIDGFSAQADEKAAVELDLRLSATLARLAKDIHNGRVGPVAGGAKLTATRSEPDFNKLLTDAPRSTDLLPTLEALEPTHEEYRMLKTALRQWRAAADTLKDVQIPEGKSFKPSEPFPAADRLAAALVALGYLEPAVNPEGHYTLQLAQGVKKFQEDAGMKADGFFGAKTLAKLNEYGPAQFDRIMVNMERWRWLPDDLGGRTILVNVPEYRVRAFENGAKKLDFRVIVGGSFGGRETPVFSEKLLYIVFRPYWNIPRQIAAKEIVPKAMDYENYLDAHHFEIVASYDTRTKTYEDTIENLRAVSEGSLKLRQTPGPWNALGRIKFIFPNDFSVYMHDTPEEHLFKESRRAFSHGCIRLEKPVDLAEFVLGGQPEWTPETIHAAMTDGPMREVEVKDKPMVYILYFTAFSNDLGKIRLTEDLYKRDGSLRKAMEGGVKPSG